MTDDMETRRVWALEQSEARRDSRDVHAGEQATRSRPALLTLLAALLLLPATPGQAQIEEPIDHAYQYQACMKLVQNAPEDAYESALAWEGRGGAAPAKHCAAVALLALDHYRDAGERFEILAEAIDRKDIENRAGALAQAGQAWILAEDLERAHAAQSAALEIAPGNVELWIDRALTLALAENYWEAIDDLNYAADLAPRRAEIFIFRASAYRYVDALELAAEDVVLGLSLDPDNPEGLLERGILRRLQGDLKGARADWLKVVTDFEGSPPAESARRNLEALDVRSE